MPVRRVSNWAGNIIGSFPSLKNGHSVPYESTIERDLLFFLEYDLNVLRYTMQPLVISGTDAEGKPQQYTPDVLIEQTSGKVLVECKPSSLVDEIRAKRQIALGQQWATANDYEFVVITDSDLRTGSRLGNLKLLWRYARLNVPHAVIERCLSILQHHPQGLSWIQILGQLDGYAPALTLSPSLFHLLFRHVLRTDLNRPLGSESIITLAVSERGA